MYTHTYMIYVWYVLWAHKGVQGPSWFFSLNKWNNQVLLLLERLPRSVLVICPGEDVSPSCTFLDAWSAELGRNFVVCVYLVYVDNSEIVLWLVEFLEHVLWNFWFLYLASHFVTWNQETKRSSWMASSSCIKSSILATPGTYSVDFADFAAQFPIWVVKELWFATFYS